VLAHCVMVLSIWTGVRGIPSWLVVVPGFVAASLAAWRNGTGWAHICWVGGTTVSCMVFRI